jgi:hypothetical protein
MKLLMISIVLAASAGTALADPPPDPVTTWSSELTERPLTLSSQLFEVRVDSTSDSTVVGGWAELGVSAAYGVTDRFTLEVAHHCGDIGACADSSETALHALYSIARSHALEVAVLAGVERYENYFDFFESGTRRSLQLGATFKLRAGQLALVVAPSVNLALGPGSDEYIPQVSTVKVPVTLEYQATSRIAAYARTGIGGSTADNSALLVGFAQSFSVPLAVGTLVDVTHRCDLGAELAYPYSLGPESTVFHDRQIDLYAQLRW